MASTFQSVSIEKTPEEQRLIMITNVVKMLMERGVLNGPRLKDSIHQNIINPLGENKKMGNRNEVAQQIAKKLIRNFRDDNTCIFPVDNPMSSDSKNYKLVLVLDQKIHSVTKSSVLADYFFKNESEHKIIIVNEINYRSKQSILSHFPLVEVFSQHELMFDIVEHIYVPVHDLLSKDETEKIREEYQLQKKDFPWVFISDPISRYYKASIGQVFRIYRASETSGLSIYYRMIIRDIVQH